MRSSDEAKVSSQLKFYPFYERLNVKLAGTVVSKIGISALLGLAFLALHYAAIGKQVFSDWSWFLAVLIGVVMLCLYFATATLRTLVAALVLQRPPPGKLASLTAMTRILSDRNFVFAGSLGGLVNCIAGYSFGLAYAGAPAAITILIGYFLAGFICGMAFSESMRSASPSSDFQRRPVIFSISPRPTAAAGRSLSVKPWSYSAP